jgi:hypothetical protein
MRRALGHEQPSGEMTDPVNFDNLKFVFAKTLPEIPHYYVTRTPQNEKGLRCPVQCDPEIRPRREMARKILSILASRRWLPILGHDIRDRTELDNQSGKNAVTSVGSLVQLGLVRRVSSASVVILLEMDFSQIWEKCGRGERHGAGRPIDYYDFEVGSVSAWSNASRMARVASGPSRWQTHCATRAGSILRCARRIERSS